MYRILILLCLLFLSTNARADDIAINEHAITIPVQDTRHPIKQQVRDTLTLVSLNIAHGRKANLNQVFVGHAKIKNNLRDIADFFNQVNADVVAVQEADGPSYWSGNFHHVEYLAEHGRYPQYIHAAHANIWIGHYGTAVISRLPIRAGYALTFPPSPPTTRKGYSLAEIEWQTKNKTVIVDVVSVHLDFSRKSVRERQRHEMRNTLSKRKNPIIILGDLNSEWIAGQLIHNDEPKPAALHTSFSNLKNLNTYKNKRRDWVLVSDAFKLESYDVSPQILSDHLAIVATISLVPSKPGIQ